MDDALDKVLAWEEAQYKEGFAEGWAAGLPEATADGTKMGAEAGCVAGLRIGYVEGYMRVLNALLPSLAVSERAQRSVTAVNALLEDHAALAAPSEDLLDKLEAKFAALALQLGVKPVGVATATLLPGHGTIGTPSAELSY
eukprot:TRINITY_DN1401_c0_g1_i1.p1 TRINITY_DN1401_c0_g1~~TRINITY_DN1401_c0_g1_i1.p1  ORF type:complete len:156 (+),score=71.00 TRINITY_DN1401_c0_g1_i1:48-470(+)